MQREICTSLVALLLTGCYNSAQEYEDLVRRSQVIEAHVSTKYCSNHGQVNYAFELNGRRHAATVPMGMLSCESARIGDPIKVFYDPEHPETNTPLLPTEALSREKGFYVPPWLIFILALPACLAIQYAQARRKKSQ